MVKSLFLLSFCVSGYADLETRNDGLIYQALNAREVNVTPRDLDGSSTHEKRVGGLVCLKMQVVYPGARPEYKCELADESKFHGAIYEALSTPEENITPDGLMGHGTFQKKIGRLVCLREQGVYPGAKPSFRCQLGRLMRGEVIREDLKEAALSESAVAI